MGGIFSLEARDVDTKLLSAPELNNTLARFLSQMAHLVANITLNSARSCVMQSAFLTQGTISSISIIFSWGGSISPEGFLSSVLLWLVIIVAVVGVTIVVVIIVAVVVVVEKSGTIVGHKVANSWNLLTSYGPYSQMVKFVFHLLDLSSGMILLYQNLLEFNLGELLFSSVAIGICQHLPLLSMLGIHAARNTISNEFLMQPESRWCIRVERSF
ncbi:hypothetical protein Tco_1407662 [Tanacetum coccineum]